MSYHFAAVAIILLSAWLAHRFIFRATHSAGRRKVVQHKRTVYVTRSLQIINWTIAAIASSLVLGINYGEVALFLSSVFAVIGVALFAQWSMLSNLTASLVIFFVFPYRVGDRIKILDKDDDITGVILEIAAFHVLIKRNDNELITYPNSLMLQKGVIKYTQP